MANRFTDTEIWRKQWYRQLSTKMKCLFKYLVDNCDHCGVLEVDLDLISFQIGESISMEELKELKESFEFEFIDDNKIFIPSFVLYQCKVSDYKYLKPSINAHKAPIKRLIELGKLPKGFSGVDEPLMMGSGRDNEHLTKGCPTHMDKDMDKDMDLDKEEEKEGQKKPNRPKDLHEVLNYCYVEKGWLEFDAFDFYEKNEENNWYKKDGTPVLSWKMWLRSWVNGKHPRKLTAALHKELLKRWIMTLRDHEIKGRIVQGIYDKLK